MGDDIHVAWIAAADRGGACADQWARQDLDWCQQETRRTAPGAVIDIQQRAETTPGHIEFEFTLNCDRACTYAIYGRALDGLKLTNVHVSVRPSGEGTPVIVRRALAPDRTER